MNKNITSILLLICFVFLQSKLTAQSNIETKTLFGNNPKEFGFFVSPAVGITQMDGFNSLLLNLRGGLSINDKFLIGGYFKTSMNDIRPQSETVPNVYMDYWTVGGFTEYTLLSKKVIHVTFPLYIGYGEVEMDNESGFTGLGEANFLEIEPAALLEVNLHKYVRFNVGVGYRIVSQMNYRNFNQSDISGLTGCIGLKFGLFR